MYHHNTPLRKIEQVCRFFAFVKSGWSDLKRGESIQIDTWVALIINQMINVNRYRSFNCTKRVSLNLAESAFPVESKLLG